MLTDDQLLQIEASMEACDGISHTGDISRKERVKLYADIEVFFKNSAYTLTTSKRGFNIAIECIQLVTIEMLEFEEEIANHGFSIKLMGEEYVYKMSFCCSDRVKSTFMKKVRRLNSLDNKGKKELHLNILGSSMFRSLIPGFTALAIAKKSSSPIQFHCTQLDADKHLITAFAYLDNKT